MGIETAILGSAVLGAGASILGGKKQASAARDATAAQVASQDRSLDLQRDIYADQRQLHQPYYQAGLQGLNGAGGVMDLLGHSSGGQAANDHQAGPANVFAPQQQSGPNWQGYLDANPAIMDYARSNPATLQQFGGDPLKLAEYHYNTMGRAQGFRPPPEFAQASPTQTSTPPTPAAPARPANDTGVSSQTQALRDTPGYQFLQDESARAIENSFASRGKLMSGAAMDALNTRTLGIADQTYQQGVNNNFNLANLGMGASAQIQGAGNSYANGASNAFANMGNAQANGAIGQADAFTNGLQGVANSAWGGLGAYGAYSGWGNNNPSVGPAESGNSGYSGISTNAFNDYLKPGG